MISASTLSGHGILTWAGLCSRPCYSEISLRLLALFLAAAIPIPLAAESPRELYQKTEYRAALAALNPGASEDPSVWHLAGRAHYQLREYKQAQEFFEKAAEAEPAKSEHVHWLGKTLGRRAETSSFITAPKYAVDCRKAFEKAVELDPKNVEAWSDLLEYYLSAPGFLGGGTEKAAAAAERIGQLDKAEGQFAQARLAEKRDDWAAAEKHWRAAAELAPKSAGRWIDLAKFLARRGRFEESEKAFEKAAEAEPSAMPKIWYAHAESNIEHKRNFSQAREWLSKYLSAQVTPDDPSKEDARRLLKKIS